MVKVYISGPITGYRYWQESFNEAEKILKEKGVTVLNPAVWAGIELEYDEYMTLDLAMLSICNYMVLLPGYEESKGCNIEISYAESRNIQTMTLQEFIANVELLKAGIQV